MTRLGFIGIGRMGTPMATHLLKAGHPLALYARRPDAATPLTALGAVACGSPREVAAQSDVVFTMVTDSAAVESIVGGDDGLLAGMRPGMVLIDHSTIAPAGARRIAERLKAHDIDMLDAPVSGGTAAASAGTLAIMVGGDEDVYSRCRPLLEHLGTTIVHVGASGMGQVAKACNQMCILANQLGVAEAVLLARRSGLDVERAKKAWMGGFAASKVLEMQGPKMAAGRFEGAIESRLHYKDIVAALEWAKELGLELPTSALAASMLRELQSEGGASLDSAAVFTILERRATSGH